MVWILLLSDMDLSTHALTPDIELMRIRSLSRTHGYEKSEDEVDGLGPAR